MGFDAITLGDTSSSITIPSQGFGQVLAASSDFTTASCDGLFVRPCSSLRTTRPIRATFDDILFNCLVTLPDSLSSLVLKPQKRDGVSDVTDMR